MRKLRQHRPELYDKVLKIDKTIISNGGFGTSRKTVHAWEKTFQEEDRQMTIFEDAV